MLLVTGGAGFIGSNLVAALNEAGRADVAICDLLGHGGKWRNLAKRQLADIVPPSDLPAGLNVRGLDAMIHLGAISETTATDGDLVIETNFRLSMRLLDWCTATATPFIYASSASTYGDGAQHVSGEVLGNKPHFFRRWPFGITYQYAFDQNFLGKRRF
jgi:ADP-L-glycero-D-manno-heptose 6-epimerase